MCGRRRSLALAAAVARAGGRSARRGRRPGGFTQPLPHYVPDAAPARFALFEDGQVFVGGSRSLQGGKLTSREAKDLEKRFARLAEAARAERDDRARTGRAAAPAAPL